MNARGLQTYHSLLYFRKLFIGLSLISIYELFPQNKSLNIEFDVIEDKSSTSEPYIFFKVQLNIYLSLIQCLNKMPLNKYRCIRVILCIPNSSLVLKVSTI